VIDFFASLHISCAFCTGYYGTIAIFKKIFYNSIEAVFLGWREYILQGKYKLNKNIASTDEFPI